jgi:hypothetical protein
MKQYERRLLNHLQEDNSKGDNDPLTDVRKAMGSIAYVAGNPLTKTEITLQISARFFDNGNAPVAPGALPANLQATLPIYLFGLTDFYGGFFKSTILLPPTGDWLLLSQGQVAPMGIIGRDISLNAVIRNDFVYGDLYLYFLGNQFLPNYFQCEVCVHCNNVAYGTFLNSFVSDLITINTLRLIVPIANINQYLNVLIFAYQTLFGKTFSDSVDPRMYITSTDFQQQICDIPINLPIDKAVMLMYRLNYNTDMSVVLFVEKVEPLTHKNNISKRSQTVQ